MNGGNWTLLDTYRLISELIPYKPSPSFDNLSASSLIPSPSTPRIFPPNGFNGFSVNGRINPTNKVTGAKRCAIGSITGSKKFTVNEDLSSCNFLAVSVIN